RGLPEGVGPPARIEDVPPALRRTEDGEVGLAVAVVVARRRHVACGAPLEGVNHAPDVPRAVRRTEDADVFLAVTVEIPGYRHIVVAAKPEVLSRPGSGVDDGPGAVRVECRDVGLAVTVEVASAIEGGALIGDGVAQVVEVEALGGRVVE